MCFYKQTDCVGMTRTERIDRIMMNLALAMEVVSMIPSRDEKQSEAWEALIDARDELRTLRAQSVSDARSDGS